MVLIQFESASKMLPLAKSPGKMNELSAMLPTLLSFNSPICTVIVQPSVMGNIIVLLKVMPPVK